MITFGSNTRVYLAAGSTDMRKAINGLMVLVCDVLEADPRVYPLEVCSQEG